MVEFSQVWHFEELSERDSINSRVSVDKFIISQWIKWKEEEEEELKK